MGAGAMILLFLLQGARAGSGTEPSAPRSPFPAGAWDDYAWPTAAGRIVTSTFGEYRSLHFHAGIDISSGDMAGYGVFASRDGYVSRIRISPTGYGKILYIRHRDGFTTTYAHLEKFAPAIDARAAAEQKKSGSYPIDVTCTSGEFPVRKGDLVALTGQTGAASPHLHFEIRDAEGNPVNPFLAPGLRVVDTIPPTITAVAVSPIGPDATVDGEYVPRMFRAESVRGGAMRVAHPIVITGNAGISLESRDRIPGSRFRNGVYTRRLFIDGKAVFATTMDATPWNEAHEIELCYEHGIPGSGGGRFAKLYMDSPNHLPFYAPRSPQAGIIDCSSLPAGEHAFRIVSADFSGNSAEVTGTLVLSRVPSGSAARSGGNIVLRLFAPAEVSSVTLAWPGAGGIWIRRAWPPPPGGYASPMELPLPGGENSPVTVTLANRWGTTAVLTPLPSVGPEGAHPIRLSIDPEEEFVRVYVRSSGVLPAAPSVTVVEGSHVSTVVMTPKGAEEYAGWFRPRETYRGTRRIVAEAVSGTWRASDSVSLDIQPVLPGTTGEIAADGGNLLIRYDSLSVLRPLLLRIGKSAGEDGTVYDLEPSDAVLGDGLTVSIRPSAPHRGLFYSRRGGWQFIGPGRDGSPSTGRITSHLGSVTLLADSTPPSLTRLSVARHAGGGSEIIARFSDDLSGVEYDGLKMYIDGNMVIPEIDGRRHRAVYRATDTLGRGPHRLTMRLTDRIGNSGTSERRFVLP